MRRGAFWKILEIVVANNQPGMFCTHSGARHPGVTIGVGEINISIDKNVLIIRAASCENKRAQDQNFESDKNGSKHLSAKSEMTASELATRPAFQIFFKCSRLAFGFERNRSLDSPRPVLGSVRACASIVFQEALIEIARNAGVVNGFVSLTHQNINVEERAHLLACQAVVFGAVKPKSKIQPAFAIATAWQPSHFRSAPKRRLGPPGFEPGTKGL